MIRTYFQHPQDDLHTQQTFRDLLSQSFGLFSIMNYKGMALDIAYVRTHFFLFNK